MGWRKGRDPFDRFWDHVEITESCWLWTGCTRGKGYGQFAADGKQWRAHRYAYVHLVGPIPEGLGLDHLCYVAACVNPDHLEPVTNAENSRRQWFHKWEMKAGVPPEQWAHRF